MDVCSGRVYLGACLLHVVFKSHVTLVDNAPAVGWKATQHWCFQIGVGGFLKVRIHIFVFEILKHTNGSVNSCVQNRLTYLSDCVCKKRKIFSEM